MPSIWILVSVAVVGGMLYLWLRRRRGEQWRRGARAQEGKLRCPHCDIEVSPSNPMVGNVSGRRIGLHAHDRWCQVCERNAEQHVIHRS